MMDDHDIALGAGDTPEEREKFCESLRGTQWPIRAWPDEQSLSRFRGGIGT